MKSVQIPSLFWSVFFCIQTEYGALLINVRTQPKRTKVWTRKNSVFGVFYTVQNHHFKQINFFNYSCGKKEQEAFAKKKKKINYLLWKTYNGKSAHIHTYNEIRITLSIGINHLVRTQNFRNNKVCVSGRKKCYISGKFCIRNKWMIPILII